MIGVAVQLYVSRCPLAVVAEENTCDWSSSPVTSEDAAREQGRAHLGSHGHGALVEFAARHTEIVVYLREQPART